MKTLLAFWAKLGSNTWPERYHPVICHLLDVAAVTRALWDAVFRPRFRRWMADRLGLDEEGCARWLAFWCGAHDIGKVAACFQDRNDSRTERLKTHLAGEEFLFSGSDRPHGTISAAVLADLLATPSGWPPMSQKFADRVAVAVGGHHGLFPPDWDELRQLLRVVAWDRRWHDARREILACLAHLIGVDGQAPNPPDTSDHAVLMVLAGLTSVADWIGSNQTFFEPSGNPDVANGHLDIKKYFDHAKDRAQKALEQLGWLGRESFPAGTRTFRELFAGILPGEPRSLQQAVEAIARDLTDPALLVIEAPMGEGKTEAAWYVAYSWDQRDGQGAYVALPTMATSNQMFDRVGAFLTANPGKTNLMLLHGKAALNDQFENLKYAAQNYDDERHPSAVVAEGWFAANKKHGLLAPYGVGTIDQALLAVLQTKHVFVRLFGLAGKCVILDEVHAYDMYMTTLMEALLRWLAALGCPVVLLSATLPREKRLKLVRAYAGYDLPEPDAVPYPRVTAVAVGGRADVRHVDADPARARTVGLRWLGEDDLAEELRKSLANGGCAAVIRNTVRLAQDTYLRLRDTLAADGIVVELFHARFPFGRRTEIENAVLKRFGKDGGPAERDKRVLVASQVVEQSLDLDFDLIVSDIAPADLVLQRAGRLHRHARGPRPPRVAEPQLWLIQPGSKEDLPSFGPSAYVYAPFLLLRSYVAFKSVEAVRLPDDLERFVELVYGTEPLAIPAPWQVVLDKYERKLREKQENQQLNAMDVAINDPDQSPLEQQSQQLKEDDPEAAKKIQALTRDSDPTIQLVVIYHVGGKDYLDCRGLEPFREAEVPDVRRVRRLLDNEITISHHPCFAFYAGHRAPKGWREKGMLQHHRIVRVDADGKAHPPDEFSLRVDHELGLRFTDD